MESSLVKSFSKCYSKTNYTNLDLNFQQTLSLLNISNNLQDDTDIKVEKIILKGVDSYNVTKISIGSDGKTIQFDITYPSIELISSIKFNNSNHSGNQTKETTGILLPLTDIKTWNVTWTSNLTDALTKEGFSINKAKLKHSLGKIVSYTNSTQAFARHNSTKALLNYIGNSIKTKLTNVIDNIFVNLDKIDPLYNISSDIDKKHIKQRRSRRQIPCFTGDDLDDYVDKTFRLLRMVIRGREFGTDFISIPNAMIEFPDQNLKIFLHDGQLRNSFLFTRVKAAWISCIKGVISVGLTIDFKKIKIAYKYRVITGQTLVFDGQLLAKMSPRIQIQLSQSVTEEDSDEPIQQRVDRFKLVRLGRTDIILKGLGNLTSSLSLIISSYLNNNLDELQLTFKMFENDIVNLINKMLKTVTFPLFSAVS